MIFSSSALTCPDVFTVRMGSFRGSELWWGIRKCLPLQSGLVWDLYFENISCLTESCVVELRV